MISVMKFPASYYQGENILLEFEKHAGYLGQSFLFIGSKSALQAAQAKIESSFEKSSGAYAFELTNGRPCRSEIARLKEIAMKLDVDVLCAIGGGGVMDIVRSIAMNLKKKLVMIPTAVASDAPCTYVSVMYSEDGTSIVGDEQFNTCPDMIFVDLTVVANAPLRLLAAGMGDALATIYEARSCYTNDSLADRITNTAMVLCQGCKDIVLQYGTLAYEGAKSHVVTDALKKIVEANCFLSGVGGLNAGCAGAHGFGDYFSTLPKGHDYMHGERVAVGLVIQMILEGYSDHEIDEIIHFAQRIGLPTSIKDLGFTNIDETSKKIGRDTENDHFVSNMKCDHSADAIYQAVIKAVTLSENIRTRS